MAQDVERIGVRGVPRGQDLEPRPVGEGQAQVLHDAVDLHEHGLLGELRPDRPRGVEAARAVGELELALVGEDHLHAG